MKSLKVSALFLAGVLAGCQTMDPYTGESKTSNATSGAVIGAVSGAVIGAATSSKKDRGKGALIGATAGGAIGGGVGYYMDQQEMQLRQRLENSGVRVAREGNEIRLIMPGNITFDTNRFDVRSGFFDTLSSVAVVLKEFDQTRVEVAGHTDSTGSLEYNQTLSEKRAQSVADYLASQGITRDRLVAVGFGPRYPLASNTTEEGRQQNRRVELKILPLGTP